MKNSANRASEPALGLLFALISEPLQVIHINNLDLLSTDFFGNLAEFINPS